MQEATIKHETPTFGNVLLPAGAVGLRVLSLFDGMSCGQQALERIGVNVLEYYASEIDKHAIAVTMHNYPNTKQLGSVVDVDGYKLPKIDLLIGGSPCQSFSFAGKRKGMSTKCETEILTLEHYLELKAEGYEFEGQSYLFWEYMRLLNEVKPKYFLLENVMMGEKWEKILSKAIGVKPIEINSALVSAQNRRRLYWTNIGMQPMGLFSDLESIIPQPKDKGILLRDVLETDVPEKYYLSQQRVETMLNGDRSRMSYIEDKKYGSILANQYKQSSDMITIVHNTMPRSSKTGKGGTGPLSRKDGKTYCLDTGTTNAIELVGHIKFGRTDEAKEMRKESMKNGKDYTPFQAKEITGIDYDKMNTLTTAINKDNLVMQLNPSNESGGKQPYQQNRIYDTDGISPALMAQMSCGTHAIKHERKIRRLTPLECERLQTVKDDEISCIFALCLEKAKSYVNVVSQNPKLLKLVLDAENSELNELVKSALLSMSVSHQSIKHTALQNVDMQIQKLINQCTNHNQQESNINVSNAELNVMCNCQKEWEDFAQHNVFINIIEGRITHFGLEELHQKDNHFTNLLNGSMPLKMYGNEIMELAKGVIAETKKSNDTNFTYTTLFHSNTKSLEQALIIYYLFAKNVIIGYTQNTTQARNILLNFNLKDGYTSVASDSQRYRMLGNGWTVDVIAHILSYGEWS